MLRGKKTTFKLIAVFIITIIVMMPRILYAQEHDIILIRKPGVTLQQTGVFFTDDAYARMKADREMLQERFDNRLDYELRMLESRLTLRTATTANALQSFKESSTARLDSKQEEIELLMKALSDAEKRIESSESSKVYWFVGGMVAVVLSGLTVYLVTAHAER